MQIQGLHKNFYKFYTYSRPQECLDRYRKQVQKSVKCWENLKSEDVSKQTCQEMAGISRATYYPHKKCLKELDLGILPPSKRPKNVHKSLGRGRKTSHFADPPGKPSNESTVGRVLKDLMCYE